MKSVFEKSCFFFGPAYLISVGYMDPETGQQTLQAEPIWVCLALGFIDE
jgi:Mn2+/Fe2+ NRAMP family transporter